MTETDAKDPVAVIRGRLVASPNGSSSERKHGLRDFLKAGFGRDEANTSGQVYANTLLFPCLCYQNEGDEEGSRYCPEICEEWT